jgi:signal transduction histidine kinase
MSQQICSASGILDTVVVDRLLSATHDEPGDAISFLGGMWLDLLGADWVWIWCRNRFTAKWELRYRAGVLSATCVPDVNLMSARMDVIDYSISALEIVAIERSEFLTWTRELGKTGERCYCCHADKLIQSACSRFVCVPVVSQADNGVARSGASLQAVISVHYTTTNSTIIDDASLLRFGRLSEAYVARVTLRHHHHLLISLGEIAARFTRDSGRSPATALREYVSQMLQMITRVARCRATTIFFDREMDGRKITCLGSTSALRDQRSGLDIRTSELDEVAYESGVGETGQAFEKCDTILLSAEAWQKLNYVEVLDRAPSRDMQIIHVPMKQMDGLLVAGCEKAIGVIRCVGKYPGRSVLDRDSAEDEQFAETDVEAMQIVADHMGSVLETLHARIARERAISIVKHDIISPVSLIRHIADELEANCRERGTVEGPSSDSVVSRGIPGLYRSLLNIQAFAIKASHLIFQLDPDLVSMTRFSPSPTKIEGEIIARLKTAMQYVAREENDMNLRFDSFVEAQFPPLNIDRDLIERVFYNVISNAIKYGYKSTTINITPYVRSSGFFVDIANRGPGIVEAERHLIFGENFRSNSVKHAFGAGLGLFIARRAMQRHGGDLRLSSLRDPTVFTLVFPARLASRM